MLVRVARLQPISSRQAAYGDGSKMLPAVRVLSRSYETLYRKLECTCTHTAILWNNSLLGKVLRYPVNGALDLQR